MGFDELVNGYVERYKETRNMYVTEIRRRKRATWEEFVTKEGNKDPWGIIYKIIREKLNKSTYLNSLILGDGTRTKDLEETAKELMRKCVPIEDQADDCDEHLQIREKIKTYKNHNLENEITQEEITEI